jgi:signal transduction histidine kinase
MRRKREAAMMTGMNPASQPAPIEPLFASNPILWLRIWSGTQGTALAVAGGVILSGSKGVTSSSPIGAHPWPAVLFAALVLYHAIGLAAHKWIIRRTWAIVLFVPLGWFIILAASASSTAFSVLILGAVLQGFIFLPFGWALLTLALVILGSCCALVTHAPLFETSLTVARIVTVLAMGITFGAVMLYIHRANRDATVRTRLLHELDSAQRDLAARAHDAGALEERQRFARDIHDTLAQGFASVIRHLEAVELAFAAPGADPPTAIRIAEPHLAHARDVSRASLAEIRRLVWALRPAQLVDASLGPAIERIVAQWSVATGVMARCSIGPLPSLLAEIEVILLRATQEALSNVVRHARASEVSVALQVVDGLVLLSIEDDGCGFDEGGSADGGRIGLVGMLERVRPYGGRVLIESVPGTGTSVTVALPLPSETQQP